MALVLLPLTGCGYIVGDDGFFRDSSNDYRIAAETPRMRIPEGKRSEAIDDIYAIPDVDGDPPVTDSAGVPRPAPLIAANADQMVRIQKLGQDSWALIAIAPGQLWPQLRSFLSAANVSVARMDARSGIIDSDYLELQGEERAARFRFRVERGVQRGNSELHVLQMYQTSADGWPQQSDNFELESEMLRGVAQFIANSADTAPVSMMAEQSISATGKVSMEERDGESFLRLELPFDRAWASMSRALENSGFAINDRNRSEGRYYVEYVGTEEEGSKSGLFGWLSGGEEEHPAAGIPLLLAMDVKGEEQMEIHLNPESQGSGLAEEDIEALLALIKGNIN